MKRSSFIKSLIGIYGLAHVPNQLLKHYEKVYLKQCFVRGFRYYEGPEMIDFINTTGMVELVREPKNKYDKRAIAIHFEGKKIGYLPQESNKTISILMDTGLLNFHCEITQIEKEAADWEKIRVAVYALKEISSVDDMDKIKPFSVLYTPKYYSLQHDDDVITHFMDPSEELEDFENLSDHEKEMVELNLKELFEGEKVKS